MIATNLKASHTAFVELSAIASRSFAQLQRLTTSCVVNTQMRIVYDRIAHDANNYDLLELQDTMQELHKCEFLQLLRSEYKANLLTRSECEFLFAFTSLASTIQELGSIHDMLPSFYLDDTIVDKATFDFSYAMYYLPIEAIRAIANS